MNGYRAKTTQPGGQKWMVNAVRKVPVGEHLVENPVILAEIRLHGTPARNIGKLHFEEIPGSQQKMMRAYADQHKPFTTPDGKEGLEIRCPANPKMILQCEEALRAGKNFKMYTPKDGIRIYGDKNLVERVKAYNKRVGFKQFPEIIELRGYLSTFDLRDGVVTMRVLLV